MKNKLKNKMQLLRDWGPMRFASQAVGDLK
jgi:hypothetical protein